MKLRIVAPLAAVAVLAAAYLGAARHAGQVIEQEVQQWQGTLAAMDEVFVHELRYERGWFGGTVHVDLSWRPLPGQPAHELLRELLGPDVDLGWRVQDAWPVQHGPWAGGAVWARAQAGLPLPSALRERLPQYPGTTPWLTLSMHMDWSRRTHVDFQGVGYQGRYVDPRSDETGRVTLQGLRGHVVTDARGRQLTLDATLAELSLADDATPATQLSLRGLTAHTDLRRDDAGAAWRGPVRAAWESVRLADETMDMQLKPLRLSLQAQVAEPAAWAPGAAPAGAGSGPQRIAGDMTLDGISAQEASAEGVQLSTGLWRADLDITQAWPFVWTGRLALSLQDLAARGPGGPASVGRLEVASETTRQGEQVDQTLTMTMSDLRAGDAHLPGMQLQAAVRGVHGPALDDVMRLVDGAWDPQALMTPQARATLEQAAQRIVRAGPSIALERFSLHVDQADDVVLSWRAGLKPDAGLAWNEPQAWGPAVQAQASASVRTAALQTLARLSVQAEAAARDEALDAAALQGEAERRHTAVMQALARQPYLEVTPQQVRSDLQWQDGTLRILGRPVDAHEGWATLAGLGALAAGVGAAASAAGQHEPVSLNTQADAMFETLRLSANFDPDPRQVELVAGGDDLLNGELGAECIGHVNAAQSDVDVVYRAGDYAMFIYADSDEDIALVVRAPDGSWHCSDDAPGRDLNPLVRFSDPLSGTYKIWVATLSEDAAQATVFVSEIEP